MKRLQCDLRANFYPRADPKFKLCGTASVYLHSVGGRTVAKLTVFDLSVVQDLALYIVILEVGTNDLVNLSPEVVGSEIEDLVRLLSDSYSVRVVGVCHVIPRGASSSEAPLFARQALLLKHYSEVVLDSIPQVFCWTHQSLPDGVHGNPAGQYHLYPSYRGAILHALHPYSSYRLKFASLTNFKIQDSNRGKFGNARTIRS